MKSQMQEAWERWAKKHDTSSIVSRGPNEAWIACYRSNRLTSLERAVVKACVEARRLALDNMAAVGDVASALHAQDKAVDKLMGRKP